MERELCRKWRANRKNQLREDSVSFKRKVAHIIHDTSPSERSRAKFVPSVPVEVALKYAMPGKVVSTRNGEFPG